MSHRSMRPLVVVAMTLTSAFALLACGGRSAGLDVPTDGGEFVLPDGAICQVTPCPPNAPFNPEMCACEAIDDAGAPIVVDATAQCPPIACSPGLTVALLGTSCACVPALDASADVTLRPPYDASVDAHVVDSGPYDAYYYQPYDAYYPPYDAYYPPYDAYSPPESGPAYDGSYCQYYNYFPCPTGYTLSPSCTCDLCPNACPLGQTPGPGCNGCAVCTTACPTGFDYGPSCTCVPHGVDAGPLVVPDAAADAGVSCLLEGSMSCAGGSWCQLGTCPDGKTEYGCYCDTSGHATCSLSCPVPEPCAIPGQASCPYGQQCVYGSCSANPNGNLLVCSCNYSYGGSGSAYCNTASCADGGPQYLPDAGPPADAGTTCLLEGYYSCSAGTFCEVGTCPSGTPYGCFCNLDGTATCDLTCPPPPDCQIPGEGTCPYGQQCVYGCGSGGGGTGLYCYCGWGGTASCNTQPCSSSRDAGPG